MYDSDTSSSSAGAYTDTPTSGVGHNIRGYDATGTPTLQSHHTDRSTDDANLRYMRGKDHLEDWSSSSDEHDERHTIVT